MGDNLGFADIVFNYILNLTIVLQSFTHIRLYLVELKRIGLYFLRAGHLFDELTKNLRNFSHSQSVNYSIFITNCLSSFVVDWVVLEDNFIDSPLLFC